jgi:hypothetical protein
MTHAKDEALQMCLEYIETDAHERKYVRHAIKQALAAQHEPENEPYVSLASVQEPVPVFELQKSGWEIICDLDWIQTLPFGTKLYTTPPPAQPAVPDAMTSADIQESIEYVAGWNECRQAMLEMMK